MNKYELVLVVKPNLEEEALKEEFEKVSALIERFSGTIDKIDDWGKRRLAYEIDKINDGVYRIIYFSAPATTPAELERRLRIDENLLRYLVTRQDA